LRAIAAILRAAAGLDAEKARLLDIADIVKMLVNAVRLGDQIEHRQIVNCDNLIRGPIVTKERAGISMCHIVRFRGVRTAASNLILRRQQACHSVHEPWPSFLQSAQSAPLQSARGSRAAAPSPRSGPTEHVNWKYQLYSTAVT
jgi:hypothetical protein